MDNGPFRAQRSDTKKPATVRSEPRVAVAPEPRVATPAYQPTAPAPAEKRSSKKWAIIIGIIVVLGLAVTSWFLWTSQRGSVVGVDSGKYQAVFFTNGQVYFGKLQSLNQGYMKLTDVYYLQAQASADESKDSENPQQTSTDQSNMQLIKLGQEVHGPEDAMIVARDQVLFYENLKSDGKVAQAIEQQKNK